MSVLEQARGALARADLLWEQHYHDPLASASSQTATEARRAEARGDRLMQLSMAESLDRIADTLEEAPRDRPPVRVDANGVPYRELRRGPVFAGDWWITRAGTVSDIPAVGPDTGEDVGLGPNRIIVERI